MKEDFALIDQVLDLANKKLELSLKESVMVCAAWERIKNSIPNGSDV